MKLNKLLALLLAVTMLFAFVGCPTGTNEPDTPDTPVTPETVADVTFEPAAGEVEEGAKIALATATEGADIYYEVVTGDAATTLTKENATTLTKYTEAFDAVAGTVYAIAVKGDKTSEITSAAYTLKASAPKVQAAPYAETPAGAVQYKQRLRFYADITEGDQKATVYWQFVEPGAESTLTKENYADPTIATPYSGSIGCEEHTSGGSYYCIAVNGDAVSEIVSFTYTYELPKGREGGLAAAAARIAEMAAARVTPTATADIKNGLVADIKDYIVTDADGLDKLAEIVNAGDTLAGYTFTQAADITFNAKVNSDKMEAPVEAEEGTPAAGLRTFAGIGDGSKAFAGTYDGNGYKISGMYIYGNHSTLGFVCLSEATTVLKNIILYDASVVVDATSGSADDRVGGFVGKANADNTQITNCVFVGSIGSEAAAGRNCTEYFSVDIGDNNKKTTKVSNCLFVARITAKQSYGILCVKNQANITEENIETYDASID